MQCASCGFNGRLYRVYGEFLRPHRIKCLKCLNGTNICTDQAYGQAFDCPEMYEPVRVDPADGRVWGAHAPWDDAEREYSWKIWFTMTDNK
jgi:hypothetical protein